MPNTLTETPTFDDPNGLFVPADGDAAVAASVAALNVGFQSLADRTQYLNFLAGQVAATQWIGPRPYMQTPDATQTSILIGPTYGLTIGGLYLAGSSTTTSISPTLGASTAYYVYASPPYTTIASGSNGQTLPQSTIHVASTTNFASSGTLYVAVTNGSGNSGIATVAYSGKTSTTFTNCTGGTGTLNTSGPIIGSAILYSASTTAPEASLTYLSGSTFYRYVGCFFTDTNSHILEFTATAGRYVYRAGANVSNVLLSAGNSTSAAGISVSGNAQTFIPGGATHVYVLCQLNNTASSQGSALIGTSTGEVGGTYAIELIAGPVNGSSIQYPTTTPLWLPITGGQDIAYKVNASSTSLTVTLLGFQEPW